MSARADGVSDGVPMIVEKIEGSDESNALSSLRVALLLSNLLCELRGSTQQ